MPELRRSCWYLIIAMGPIAAVFYWVARVVHNRGAVDAALGCLMFGLVAVAVVVPLRWRLRVDEAGLSRRLLFQWDLWPWSDIESGRVRKLRSHTLYDPGRLLWNRWLSLGYMSEGDIQKVIEAVNERYVLPPPPDLPAKLTIKYGFRRSANFDRNGIHLMVRGEFHEYLWQDIREIHIHRSDPVRRDFMSLIVTLPDQRMELRVVTHQNGATPTWRGATAEEVNEFLLQHAPEDRISVSVEGKPSTNRDYVEKRLKEVKETRRAFDIAMAVLFPLLLVGFGWMAVQDGILKAVVMGTAFCTITGAPVLFVRRLHRERIDELTKALEDIAETESSESGNA